MHGGSSYRCACVGVGLCGCMCVCVFACECAALPFSLSSKEMCYCIPPQACCMTNIYLRLEVAMLW